VNRKNKANRKTFAIFKIKTRTPSSQLVLFFSSLQNIDRLDTIPTELRLKPCTSLTWRHSFPAIPLTGTPLSHLKAIIPPQTADRNTYDTLTPLHEDDEAAEEETESPGCDIGAKVYDISAPHQLNTRTKLPVAD
jgi:hypothetical protein